jgi:membrane-bound lytic murein transglycosylase B
MMQIRLRPFLFVLTLLFAASGAFAAETVEGQPDTQFQAWLDELRTEALAKGISADALDAGLKDVAPIPRIIELDRRQPEFTQTFWRYIDLRINNRRIKRGRKLLKQHKDLLWATYKKYGVQPRFLVAFWGLESNFGDHYGGFPVISAVATLAYDNRRSKFFRRQLLDALRIIDRGDIAPEKMRGSWAGAMGHLQFIPSTFITYAADGDGDGRRDIWNSLPDVFATAANYLSKIGWNGGQTWGREVKLPKNFDYSLASFDVNQPIEDWHKIGVRRANGKRLPRANMEGAITLPAGADGPAFIVYKNFHKILNWNRSVLYAVAVGHLADRYINKPRFTKRRPKTDRPVSRKTIVEIQQRLLALGHEVGSADGIAGTRTRRGIRAFQKRKGYPADGYPSAKLLKQLRNAERG